MKRINQMHHRTASFSRLRQRPGCGACLACEADLSGRQYKARASSGKLSSASANRSDARPHRYAKRCGRGALEHWSVGEQDLVFCGLGLEVFARPVINGETVLPKAARTAGITCRAVACVGGTMPRLNLGVANAGSPRRAATISLERRVVSKQ
jgi:hypothetical protein